MKKAFLTAITAGLFALNQMSFAATENFTVSLDAAQAGTVGAGGTGSGSGTLSYDTVASTLTLNNITYSGLSAPATAGHIHGPADTNTSADVLQPFPGVSGTSGTVAGTLILPQIQLTNVIDGMTYINIHTTNNPGGEIRGQVIFQ